MEDISLQFGLGQRIFIYLYLGSSIEYVQNKEELLYPNFMVEKFPEPRVRDLDSKPSSESHLLCDMFQLSFYR